MDFLWDKITEWLKEMLIGGIVSNLSGMFDATNQKVAEISGQVGLSPQAWNGSIFNMIQNLSETVIVPIAGAILAFVMTLELIQLITDKNNLNDMDTWIFFKWAFKSAAAVLIVTNTWPHIEHRARHVAHAGAAGTARGGDLRICGRAVLHRSARLRLSRHDRQNEGQKGCRRYRQRLQGQGSNRQKRGAQGKV